MFWKIKKVNLFWSRVRKKRERMEREKRKYTNYWQKQNNTTDLRDSTRTMREMVAGWSGHANPAQVRSKKSWQASKSRCWRRIYCWKAETATGKPAALLFENMSLVPEDCSLASRNSEGWSSVQERAVGNLRGKFKKRSVKMLRPRMEYRLSSDSWVNDQVLCLPKENTRTR